MKNLLVVGLLNSILVTSVFAAVNCVPSADGIIPGGTTGLVKTNSGSWVYDDHPGAHTNFNVPFTQIESFALPPGSVDTEGFIAQFEMNAGAGPWCTFQVFAKKDLRFSDMESSGVDRLSYGNF